MTVTIHDDGKEKDFSFEASIADAPLLASFGASADDAIAQLKDRVQEYISQLQNIDYAKITFVDCFGRPISQDGEKRLRHCSD